MEVILKLDKLLEREKEVFDQYIKNQREIDMLPLIEKYSKEDGKLYDIETIYQYLKLYTTSKSITEEELAKFEQAKRIEPKEIFKRGKKVVKELIMSNGDEKELSVLASEFTKLDGRIKCYSVDYVKKCMEYYKRNTKNTSLINTLDTVADLVKNKKNKEFDLSLVNAIISFDNIVIAVNFIKSINISQEALIRLIDTYRVLYPANIKEILYLDEIIKELKSQNRKNFLPKGNNNKSNRLAKLSHLLEIYLTTDVDNIFKIEGKYHMSEYEFNLSLKEGLVSNDPIILSLIDKYNIKEKSIEETQNAIVIKIGNAILNGVNYGNGYQHFNIIDYFNMCEGLALETIKFRVKILFNADQNDYILSILNKLDFKTTYSSVNDLNKNIGIFSKNGRNMTSEEKEGIIDYMLTNNLPINNTVFFAACEKYFNGDLEINFVKKVA